MYLVRQSIISAVFFSQSFLSSPHYPHSTHTPTFLSAHPHDSPFTFSLSAWVFPPCGNTSEGRVMRLPCSSSSLQPLSLQTLFIVLIFLLAFILPSDEYTPLRQTRTPSTPFSNSILFLMESPKPRSSILTDLPQLRRAQLARLERRSALGLCRRPRHASATWRFELVVSEEFGNATSTNFSRTSEMHSTGLRSPAIHWQCT